MQQHILSIILVFTVQILPTKQEKARTFCEQNDSTDVDVSSHPLGSMTTPQSAVIYNNCNIHLTGIPEGSWCGIEFTKLDLMDGDKLIIQSGISGENVEIGNMTITNRFYIPTMTNAPTSNAASNRIKFLFIPSAGAGSETSSQIALTYKVAHVMDETNRTTNISIRPDSRGFIVSHKEFDFGTTRYRSGLRSTKPLSLMVGERAARVDIKFHYINLRHTMTEACDSHLKFDTVRGYTDDYYFELCAQTTTDMDWDYHLYPFVSGGTQEIKLTFESSQATIQGYGGFLLEYRVVRENLQTGAGCDMNFIKNADLAETRRGEGTITYNMTCRSGTTTNNINSTEIKCDSDGWKQFLPCTRDRPSQAEITTIEQPDIVSTSATSSTSAAATTTAISPSSSPPPSPSPSSPRTTRPTTLQKTASSIAEPKTSSSDTPTGTTASTTEEGESSLGNQMKLIIGLACGVTLVIVVIVVILVVVCMRKRRNSPIDKKRHEMTNNNEEGSVTVPLTLYNGDGGHIYELADEGAILPDVVTHRTPLSPSPQPAAEISTPDEPDDDSELDYGNASTITGQHQMANMSDLYSPVLASQKKPKQPQVDLVDNDLYGSS